MKSLNTLLREEINYLENKGIPEARLDAWLLLEYVLGRNRAWFLAHSDESAEESLEQRYHELIVQRGQHIPLQHLTHQAWFMGYEFYVNEHVLIPRQDTETLVEEALEKLKKVQQPHILDMCTGSGCILLSLLMEREDATGVGVDLSPDALAVAQRNSDTFGINDRIRLVESDLFCADLFAKKDGKSQAEYDMLVSNPPYIPTSDIESLMEEVRLHDPLMALDGREDGLFFYREITAKAGTYLKDGGSLICEIGYDQGEAVRLLYEEAGFEEVRVIRDLAGLDRVVAGVKPAR